MCYAHVAMLELVSVATVIVTERRDLEEFDWQVKLFSEITTFITKAKTMFLSLSSMNTSNSFDVKAI